MSFSKYLILLPNRDADQPTAKRIPNEGPFREPSAVYAGVEILQIEELIERAGDRIAQRGSLFFELLHAPRFRRPNGCAAPDERRSFADRHDSYQTDSQEEIAW